MTQNNAVTTLSLTRPDDVDLAQVFAVLRRSWLPLFAVPTLLGLTTYFYSNLQPPSYEASTRLMAAIPDSGNSVVMGSSITASQLPQGAVDSVVHSRRTVSRIEEMLNASDLPDKVRLQMRSDLEKELSSGKFSRVQVKAKLDQLQRGTYEILANAETPQAAKFLATAATRALLEWDLQRAQEGVRRASQTIQQQLDNVNARLKEAEAGSVEQQSLIAARGQLILNLSQATAFVEGARGNLTLLAEANSPSQPVSPQPKRNAALAFLLSLFAGCGLALLLDALRRKIQTGSDLIGLGVKVLGELPRLRNAQRQTTVEAVRSGDLYEPVGFVRVNLDSGTPGKQHIIAVSSPSPGEGKSTLAAALAASFAQASKRVLLIDADLHRPVQNNFWPLANQHWMALPGALEVRQTDLTEAVLHPESASAIDLGDGVYLLPSSRTGRRSAGILSGDAFPHALKQWAEGFDVVILDTPPVLNLADAFVYARHADGLVLVVESGETALPEVQRVLHSLSTSGTHLLGVVVNKVRRGHQGYYGYRYSQT